MPCDYKKYPRDWKQIRARILERAGDRCEQCGIANRQTGARDRDGTWHSWYCIERMDEDEVENIFGTAKTKVVKIVLTISHTDHDVTNNDDSNLRALCQRCHLRHDSKLHAENAAATRRAKRDARSGQQRLEIA